jgi:hypothetical protein
MVRLVAICFPLAADAANVDLARTGLSEAIVGLLLIFCMKVVVFLTGYLIVRLGYNLILSGAKGEFTFKTKLLNFQADLASLSPGLLFVLLGTMLIGWALFVPKPVDFNFSEKRSGPSPTPPDLTAPPAALDIPTPTPNS